MAECSGHQLRRLLLLLLSVTSFIFNTASAKSSHLSSGAQYGSSSAPEASASSLEHCGCMIGPAGPPGIPGVPGKCTFF